MKIGLATRRNARKKTYFLYRRLLIECRRKKTIMPSLTNLLHHPGGGPRLIAFILFVGVVSHSLPLAAQEAQGGDSGQRCLDQLKNASRKNIDCTLKFDLDEKTQKDLKKITAGVIRNAVCKVDVTVTREMIFSSLLNQTVLEIPRQPVQCQIMTKGDPFSAQFTLAPRVWFEGGKAVHAKPGMGDMMGMPPILAILLTNWVNSSKMIESAMIEKVNEFLKMEYHL